MARTVAKIIGGRRIWQHDPIGHFVAPWYSVELRGPMFEGQPIEVHWGTFDNLPDAIAEAQQRGPMPDHVESWRSDSLKTFQI